MSDSEQAPKKSLNPLSYVGSTLAAAFGVQSSKNRERDFQDGKAIHFIATGIIATVLFVGGMYLLVKLILDNAR
ncbi:DUF2970 domain-containing protein [Halieaceae bacterium IMCC14734]|uniref:DUF2970 domain-containing protein n=1 Tax=Candidatus Litorirhabdus singularis TaxID=2518993 RepID=A0ABT3TGE2_9GAMM|nr:DUF2970 domain-containing protein [Candidatus Litorirhabdus singularis]MCX2981351.1 DUF2970 domain-containing protein [Candidatus Litorirhabdus singularis]